MMGIGPISCLLISNKPVFPVRRLILRTSTYVEKTTCSKRPDWLDKDHLHLRGENHDFAEPEILGKGSPPLTWRKHQNNTAVN